MWTILWNLICIQGSWRNCLMWLPTYSPSNVKSYGCQMKTLLTGKKVEKETWETTGFTSVLGNITEQTILESVLKHVKEKEVIQDSHHGFTKGRSCHTNLEAFSSGVTTSVDKEGAADVIYLNFCKAFDVIPHHRLISNLERWIWRMDCSVDKKLGDGHSKKVVVSSSIAHIDSTMILWWFYNSICGATWLNSVWISLERCDPLGSGSTLAMCPQQQGAQNCGKCNSDQSPFSPDTASKTK